MSRGLIAGLLLVCSSPAWATPYWARYDAASGQFPEEQGWVREIYPPAALRSLEDGALVIDSRADIHTADTDRWTFPDGGMNPAPGELFVVRWRLRVDAVSGYWDPGIDIISDDMFSVGFLFGYDRLVGLVEPGVYVPFTPGVFHTYELLSSNMRTYELNLDGTPAYSGTFRQYVAFPPAGVQWGDCTQGGASRAAWGFCEFGVIPEIGSASAFLVAIAFLPKTQRRFRV